MKKVLGSVAATLLLASGAHGAEVFDCLEGAVTIEPAQDAGYYTHTLRISDQEIYDYFTSTLAIIPGRNGVSFPFEIGIKKLSEHYHEGNQGRVETLWSFASDEQTGGMKLEARWNERYNTPSQGEWYFPYGACQIVSLED